MMPTHYGKFSRSSKISLLSPVPGAMPSASKPVRCYIRNGRFYGFGYIFRFGFTLARWPFRSSFRVGFAARVRVPRALMARGAAAICAAYLASQTPKHPAYQWRESRSRWFLASWPRIALVIYLRWSWLRSAYMGFPHTPIRYHPKHPKESTAQPWAAGVGSAESAPGGWRAGSHKEMKTHNPTNGI